MIVKEPDLTGKTLSNYKVMEQLGRGGMATVYKAHELSLNRMVALKVLSSRLSEDHDYIKRFQREAQAAAQLNHPNIVQIYSIGEENGLHYFAMEYIKGESLADLKKRTGVMQPAHAVRIIKQVADGLADAHAAGLVHRDIKPSNIMMDANNRPKVTDFGIAFVISAKTKLTQDGSIIGTPEYLSPEQCEGKTVDQRSDIYSLGVTLYELLTGKTPYEADTPVSMLMKIVKGNFPPICEVNAAVPQPLCLIVDKMMETDPAQRYPSMREVIKDFEALAMDREAAAAAAPMATMMVDTGEGEPLPPPAEPAVVGVETRSGSSNKTAAFIVAAVIVLLMGGAFAAKMLFTDKKETKPDKPPVVTAADTGQNTQEPKTSGDEPATMPGEQSDNQDTTQNVDESVQNQEGAVDSEAGQSGPETTSPPEEITHQTVQAASIDPGAGGVQQGEVKSNRGSVSSGSMPSSSSTSTSMVSSGGGKVAVSPRPRPRPLPPANSCMITTMGDSDKADIVGAYLQEMLGRKYDMIDRASKPGKEIEEIARNHIVVNTRQLGSTMLEYYGQSTEQYTAAITVKLVSPQSGKVIKGPRTRTVQYTALNAEENLREAVAKLLMDLRL